ncbi:iron ABC transporter substrate-binding protein [Pleomorphomonas diazotrophica]|uniref:Iron ABC transporter substrate-binding protein n=1 Tax=Pleomorphomonas diazotrophica TaxID=1166257 RepID=A0A1I4TGY6_9HYPH|nr:siderophore ABC transporter substrate-binding protein [Pleomorphomonas diazotrophica]PKR87249.1 iron ABC transporter substrate-binding protein [Pleomorphomonas diazotrophica]SFM75959.1 iron complex transport system substrate-binding protein [Pleomorphomonas diazotrophica]
MIGFRHLGAVLALFLLFAGSGTVEAVTITDAQGTHDLPDRPKTVVVFDLAALDTFDTLGVEVKGVPDWSMTGELEKYGSESYTKVGSLFEPDLEAVAALEPDLIVVGARSQKHVATLSEIAPVLDLTPDNGDFRGSVKRNAEAVGKLFGKEAEVAERLRKLDATMARLRQMTAGKGRGLVVLTTGGKISAYGPGSRFAEVHDLYGLAAADPTIEATTHGQVISWEYILKVNPDWLIVIDRDAAIGKTETPARALLDNELVNRTRAATAGHVVYLDPVAMYLTSSGLRAEQAIADSFIAAFGRP